jgi:hypothetical protein
MQDPAPPAPPAPPAAADRLLDADLVAALDEALDPAAGTGDAALDSAAQARIRRRLLRRIAADNTPRQRTVPADATGWAPFGKGLTMKVLHEEGGVMSYLVRLQAGARLPAHRHPMDEECVVLEGRMCIGDVVLGPGAYHRGFKDVLHDELWAPEGALIFLRGAVPEPTLAL